MPVLFKGVMSLTLWTTAVTFLRSMGLPQPMMSVTRKQVEQGNLDDFVNELEWNMYSRHDRPTDD